MKKTNKQITVLIPNGTSPKNIGDLAMLEALMQIIRAHLTDVKILLHTFDVKSYEPDFRADEMKQTLYGWAVFEKTGIGSRLLRVFQILLSLVSLRFGLYGFVKQFLSPVLCALLEDYRRSDFIVFAAGGYLRSKKGISQTLNFIMQLVPFWIASLTGKYAVVAPISYGPFAYSWHSALTAYTLKKLHMVFAREEISYNKMKNDAFGNLFKSSDLALSLATYERHKKYASKRPVIGYTIRTWFPKDRQRAFERQYAIALVRFAKETGAVMQPIIQVDAVKYGDDDVKVTERVAKILNFHGVKVLPTVRTRSLPVLLQAYGSVDVLVGMRMHANILAATQGTPFVGIAYEHKTFGIARQLEMESFCIGVEFLTDSNLYQNIKRVYKQRAKLRKIINNHIRYIRAAVFRQWGTVLRKRIMNELFHVAPKVSRNKPTVTVALSAYNEEKNIVSFLRSLAKQKQEGYTLEKILIVSDGSTDQTVEKIRNFKNLPVEVIDSPTRMGKSTRLNQIYRMLDSDILVQTDADVIFGHTYCIRDLIKPLAEDRSAGMTGGNPTPLQATTFVEQAVNSTVHAYMRLRHMVRGGNNIFSVDGRLLGFRKELVETISVPSDMIANDRYTYYCCLTKGYSYSFAPSAVVYFRSPQTLKDHIRQNTRFLAAPIRMGKYFDTGLIKKEEFIPRHMLMYVYVYQWLRHPLKTVYVFVINRYCRVLAFLEESKLTAKWDIAYTTKKVIQ